MGPKSPLLPPEEPGGWTIELSHPCRKSAARMGHPSREGGKGVRAGGWEGFVRNECGELGPLARGWRVGKLADGCDGREVSIFSIYRWAALALAALRHLKQGLRRQPISRQIGVGRRHT